VETRTLIQQIASGNVDAFEQLFRVYYKPLVGYAAGLTHDVADAEEIVQDVFTAVWTKRQELKDDIQIKSYLYKAVHNRCMNYFRHQKVKQQHREFSLIQISTGDESSASSRLALNELKNKLHEGLLLLPPACREVFTLSRMEQLSYREISEVLNISVKTVENQMGKALKLMRKHLADFISVAVILHVTTKFSGNMGVSIFSSVFNLI
jgi:RNA polymerase sigma-70 factor (ECF subfamily)